MAKTSQIGPILYVVPSSQYKLVGTFLLNKISEKYDKNSIGLYLDDELTVFKKESATQLERIKKSLQKTFKDLTTNRYPFPQNTFNKIFNKTEHQSNNCKWQFLCG